MGRPPTKPKRFKDGFYIEVRNKGANMGMKIHFDTEAEMNEAAIMYGSNKEVVVLGEHKKDRWLNQITPEDERRLLKQKAREEKLLKAQKAQAEKAAKPAKAEKPAKPAKKVKEKTIKKVKPVKKAVAKKAKPAPKAKAKKKK